MASLPGATQTVPRAEAFAILRALQLSCRDVELATDAAYVERRSGSLKVSKGLWIVRTLMCGFLLRRPLRRGVPNFARLSPMCRLKTSLLSSQMSRIGAGSPMTRQALSSACRQTRSACQG